MKATAVDKYDSKCARYQPDLHKSPYKLRCHKSHTDHKLTVSKVLTLPMANEPMSEKGELRDTNLLDILYEELSF